MIMNFQRNHPYAQFNFLVKFGTSNSAPFTADFQECSAVNPSMVAGKVPGLRKTTDVTLKRGVVASSEFSAWMNELRAGNANAKRIVVISRQKEDRSSFAQTWKLTGARIIKHTSGPLNAKGTDMAMEELTLSYERLEIE